MTRQTSEGASLLRADSFDDAYDAKLVYLGTASIRNRLMQPSAALSKFATWSRNLGVACAVRYTLYRILNRTLGGRVLTLNVRGFPQPRLLSCRG